MVLAVTLSFWFDLAANAGLGRSPTPSGYQYVGAVLLLLIGAEFAAGAASLTAILLLLSIAGSPDANMSILHSTT